MRAHVHVCMQGRRATVKEYREKKKRLEHMKIFAEDAEEAEKLQSRVQAIDDVIQRELDEINVITSENKALRQEIIDLKSQFERAHVESEVCMPTHVSQLHITSRHH